MMSVGHVGPPERRLPVLARVLCLCWALVGRTEARIWESGPAYVYEYTLEVSRQPAAAYGGQSFGTQPEIKVYYDQVLNTTFDGYVYAEVERGPTNVEKLRFGNATAGATNGQVRVAGGAADFAGLYINEVGTYLLRFVLESWNRTGLAWVLSKPFQVRVGMPYALGLIKYPDRAVAGELFAPQPVVALLDRGANVVTTYTYGHILARAYKIDANITQDYLQPVNGTSVAVVNGTGTFKSLYIKEGSSTFVLVLTCDLQLEGLNRIESLPFKVHTGPFSQIMLVRPISSVPVKAGKPFTIQPEIQVQDKGGNIVTSDSSSKIRVVLLSNSTGAHLLPTHKTLMPVIEGTVNFTLLHIDTMGSDYMLKFTLHSYDSRRRSYSATNITTYSEIFMVELGNPSTLRWRDAFLMSDKRASGQAFLVPPVVEVVDPQGTVVPVGADHGAFASMTSSVGFSRNIKIFTANNPIVNVTHVDSNKDSLYDTYGNMMTFGVGELMTMTLHFADDVVLDTSAGHPYVELNITSLTNATNPAFPWGYASLLDRHARCVTPSGRWSELQFEYIVQEDDWAFHFEYVRHGWNASEGPMLRLNGSTLRDVLGRNVSLALPYPGSAASLSGSKLFAIDSTPPVVMTVTTKHPSGEIGAGEVFTVLVNFSRPVVVKGTPLLPVNTSMNATETKFAVYSYGNGTYTVGFNYTVQEGDHVPRVEVREDLSIFLHTSPVYEYYNESDCVVYNSTVNSSYAIGHFSNDTELSNCTALRWNISDVFDDSILFASTYPQQSASLSLGALWERITDSKAINIDTIPPHVDPTAGVYTSSPDGNYAAGDKIYLHVNSTLPLSVQPGVQLLMKGMYGLITAEYVEGDGTTVLTFMYEVKPFDYTLHLDTLENGAITFYDGGYIRRFSTYPTTDADTRFNPVNSSSGALWFQGLVSAGSMLANQSTLSIDALPTVVTSVSLHTGMNSDFQTYGLDAGVYINVDFSSSVEVQGAPVLVVQVGVEREAVYITGSGTSTLTFKYTVQYGDYSPWLGFRYSPTALCVASGCPAPSETAYIRQLSSNSTYDAVLRLNRLSLWVEWGRASVPFCNVTIDTSTDTRATTVVSVDSTTPSGVYGVGQDVEISVTFTDEVFLSGTMPSLLTTLNRTASYSTGDGSKVLSFVLEIIEDDGMAAFDFLLNATTSAVVCGPRCNITNANGQDVDLDMTLTSPLAPHVVIDATPPYVVDVFTLKNTSVYDEVHGIGEEIDVLVEFSAQVTVEGAPRLKLDTGQRDRYAVYEASASSGNLTAFRYTVQAGDYSNDLTYTDRNSLETGTEETGLILRNSTNPSQMANMTLPPPQSLRLYLNSSIEDVSIDGRNLPRILNVTCRNASGIYAPGDDVVIDVEFTRAVVVTGVPILHLKLTDFVRDAVFIGLPNVPSHVLTFQYTVQSGDRTWNLDYVDHHSLERGYGEGAVIGSIRQSSTNPTASALLHLPFPGQLGSLSSNGDIVIDGARPYITDLDFWEHDGTYSLGDVIYLVVTFSAPVTVYGSPYMILETGAIDRHAVYYNGSDTDVLSFEYVVHIGDDCDYLDYAITSAATRSAVASFQLNGGWIRRSSADPVLDADLHLNPPNAELAGRLETPLNGGAATFDDLRLDKRGLDYKVHMWCNASDGHMLTTETVIEVTESAEFELRGKGYASGESFGYSVDIEGNYFAVGVPAKHKPVTEVQTVRTAGSVSVSEAVYEKQVFGTQEEFLPEIQTFETSADPDRAVGGYFQLSMGDQRTRPIETEATATALSQYLMDDFPGYGTIFVSRSDNTYCECGNAYHWTITFLTYQGQIGPLDTHGEGLTGDGAAISDVETLQDSPRLDGTFTLSVSGLTTRDLPFDASDSDVSEALAEDLGLNVYAVSAQTKNPTLGKTWFVTLGDQHEEYDVPQITTDASGLSGNNPHMWYMTAVNGTGPLAGSFQLSFAGSNWTHRLAYNVSAADMRLALEGLASIEDVTVERSPATPERAYVWTITFNRVRRKTSYGFVYDPSPGNLEPLQVQSHLIGTGARIWVGHKSGGIDDAPFWSPERMGSSGADSGEAVMYKSIKDMWHRTALLTALDTDSQDRFGHAIDLSLVEDRVVIGAPGADDEGWQTYLFSCNASAGSFTLNYRGFYTQSIAITATLQEFLDIVNGAASKPQLPTQFPTIRVSGWDDTYGPYICQNKTFLLIAQTPSTGHSFYGRKWMTADGADLNGTVRVNQTFNLQGGAYEFTGTDQAGVRMGAAYVFRKLPNDSWVQEAKLKADDGHGNDRFGWSVAYHGNFSLAGAPGSDSNSGAAYLYQNTRDADDTEMTWRLHQKLTSEAWSVTPGDYFGDKVIMTDRYIVISAPGYGNRTGAVYVFGLQDSTFVAAQKLRPPPTKSPVQFGCSIDVDGTRIAVGACGYSDTAMHLISDPPATRNATQSGAVFVYDFDEAMVEFVLTQKLSASNVKEYDRLGWRVQVSNDTLLAGSLKESGEELRSRCPVQSVAVTAKPWAAQVGNTFQLQWMTTLQDGRWLPQQTRELTHDISAEDLRQAMEEDLNTGKLSITRSEQDISTGGYSWTVTFHDFTEPIEPLSAVSRLSGTDARAFVAVLNQPPRVKVRSVIHAFKLNSVTGVWTEQAYLYPALVQKQDLFGFDVALDAVRHQAIIGMPNRDTYVSGTNDGAVMVYDLSLLTLAFDQPSYDVVEGQQGATVSLNRVTSAKDGIPFKIWTIDRNAESSVQNYVKYLYDIMDVPEEQSVTDLVGAGTATARAQFYGSWQKLSLWVDGEYDYRALSDYLPTRAQVFLDSSEWLVNYTINVTNDNALEKPDETFVVTAYQPGIFASPLGDLWRMVTIEDDGDGLTAASLEPSFYKLKSADIGLTDAFGTAIAVCEAVGVALISAPQASYDGMVNTGAAYLYQRSYGSWVQVKKIVPQNATGELRFGQSVAMDGVTKGNSTEVTALVGAPGQARVYVYTRHSNGSWVLDQIFSTPEADRPHHRFGGTNGVAISGDVAVVGAPGLETVYVWERTWVINSVVMGSGGAYVVNSTHEWHGPRRLRGLGYDYDVVIGKTFVHRRDFGASVAVSGRTFVVGAPLGDYPNLGSEYVEKHRTDGEWHEGLAHGEVHVFHAQPEVWVVRMKADVMPHSGTWELELYHIGVQCTMAQVSFDADALLVKEALEGCPNAGTVEVTRADQIEGGVARGYAWSISFVSSFAAVGDVYVRWDGDGVRDSEICLNNCTFMSDVWSRRPSDTFATYRQQDIGSWMGQTVLHASDKNPGDLFGYNLAMDKEQLGVTALHSSAFDYTTWDFETGDLQGWTKTGNAFDFQPTFGDNPLHRSPVYSHGVFHAGGHSQRTGLQGRYFIGTFEKRPGSGGNDYLNAHTDYVPGNHQGDEPTGTLTSQPFMILGDSISFLIGGGCDANLEYVELLVDGYAVARETGMCSERMYPKMWNVSAYAHRVGQIRIVDASSADWAHINVDDFRFAWSIHGGRLASSGRMASYTAQQATPRSGAVYAFWRRDVTDESPCTGDRMRCEWVEQARLQSSDKRQDQLFGCSVAVDDSEGVLVVGASGAMLTGVYKELQGVHPREMNVTRIDFPLAATDEGMLQMQNTFGPQNTGSRAVWVESKLLSERERGIEPRWSERSGAVYVFHRLLEVYGTNGELLAPRQWTPVEQFEMQPPDARARDFFGSSVALSGQTLLVGAIGQDSFARDGGAAYQYKLGFQHIFFTQSEYVTRAGAEPWVELTLARSEDSSHKEAVVTYATNDLSARGVDSNRFRECIRTNVSQRQDCGDYMQATGQVAFGIGETRKRIKVYIMDDNCREPYSKFAQVTLAVPGAGPILGENYIAKLRIDHDSRDGHDCTSGL